MDNSIIQLDDYRSLKEKQICLFVYNPYYPGEMSMIAMSYMADPPKQYKQKSNNMLVLILDIEKDNYTEYVDKYFKYYKPHGVVLPGFDTNSIKFQHLDKNCIDFSLSTQMIREYCIRLYLHNPSFCLLGICRGFQDIMSVIYEDRMTMYKDESYFLNVLEISIPFNDKTKTEKYFTGNQFVVKLLDEQNIYEEK
ncbi:MAG: hypothetical protein OEZ01_08450, partial [Candidatus Heimdallarchaeota archaeon]|nr:hypothetical protein [Candidatus Heimdallarchaeota archaeon]